MRRREFLMTLTAGFVLGAYPALVGGKPSVSVAAPPSDLSAHSRSPIPTGIRTLDQKIGGFHRGDLIFTLGRASVGKTAFAMNIAEQVALYQGLPTLFFSLECPREWLFRRMVESMSGTAPEPMVRAGSRLKSAPLYIDDTLLRRSTEMAIRARQMSRDTGPLGLIIVDYFTLLGDYRVNENDPSHSVVHNLKQMAIELNTPVLVLSPCSRRAEMRRNKRPLLGDLNWPQNWIKEYSDLILFLYRDELYDSDSPDKGIAELIIAKHRRGPLGTLRLSFRGHPARFMDI